MKTSLLWIALAGVAAWECTNKRRSEIDSVDGKAHHCVLFVDGK